MMGLPGHSSDDFQPGKGLWLMPCQWMYTFGMSFPMDAVYLNFEYKVIHTYRKLRPSRLVSIKIRARSIIKLPAGTISGTQTAAGEQLELKALEER
mgnify:CR=1 FL=1